jgi:hypothetical protein
MVKRWHLPRARFAVQMDHFASPVLVVREGSAVTIVHARERPDLQELHFGGENAQVSDVTLETGEELTLVRSLGRRGWFLLHDPAVSSGGERRRS